MLQLNRFEAFIWGGLITKKFENHWSNSCFKHYRPQHYFCLFLLIVFFLLPASEPNLKVKHKLKKHLNTRKSPLTRKESAPPTVKHRVPDTLGNFTIIISRRATFMHIHIPWQWNEWLNELKTYFDVLARFWMVLSDQVFILLSDSSPSSSSTPVSGCSSPNDSLPNENGVLPPSASLSHEVTRNALHNHV